MRRLSASLTILVAACAAHSQPARGPATVGEQLDCGLNVAFGGGYSATTTLKDEGRRGLNCVEMRNAEGSYFDVCVRVRNESVIVSGGRPKFGFGENESPADQALSRRIPRVCPARPLRK
jgi:hypothetical protein